MTRHTRTGRRAKPRPDRLTSDLRRMILGALADAGGRQYLARQAVETPGAFLALLGRVCARPFAAKEAGPRETPRMSDLEVARRLAFLLARGAQALEARVSTIGAQDPRVPPLLDRAAGESGRRELEPVKRPRLANPDSALEETSNA